MNNVVDEVLNTSATDNKIKYRITHSDNTTEDVQIDLITPVTTAGTPLNKALFDSIQADLNTRLLISNKATTAQAQAGTNDTNYMTPLKTKQSVNQFDRCQELKFEESTQSGTTAKTLYTFDNTKTNVIHIDFYGFAYGNTSHESIFTLNGTGMAYQLFTLNSSGVSNSRHYNETTQAIKFNQYKSSGYNGEAGLQVSMNIDFKNKTYDFKSYCYLYDSGNKPTIYEMQGTFTTLTDIQLSGEGSNSNCSYGLHIYQVLD